ncbi:MAG TPA: hypothetical protein VMR52_12910 [Dehalococcoidia bacterium]|nr:hypothetical protein [Dehalococcoidia bacterium]
MNSAIRDLIEREGWHDPDNFSLRLAQSVSDYISRGYDIDQAIRLSVQAISTKFYTQNRGAKSILLTSLPEVLMSREILDEGLLEPLRRFKDFAEHQLVSDLTKQQTEEVCRSHLQTAIHGLGRTYREVPLGAGRSDILIFLPDSREVVEAKLWKGRQYHEDGLAELTNYLKSERLARGYYVVFEFYKLDPLTPEEEAASCEGIDVHVLYVHLPLTPPSKLGRERRKASR